MSTKSNIQKKRMIEALKKTLGVVSEAAKIAELRRATHYYWLNKDADYKIQVENISEDSIDFVESKLFERIKGYKHPEDKIFQYEGVPVIVPTTKHYPPDVTAAIFYLKTKAKHRGYVERQEVEHDLKGANIIIEPQPEEED